MLIGIFLASLLAAGLTFFSGFGLGTLLMPVFALFFPLPVAVAATAVVHLANNLFKAGLIGRLAHWPTVWRFGLPAIPAAFAGAWLLQQLGTLPLWPLEIGGHPLILSPLKVLMGLLILGFALLELSSRFEQWSVDARWMPFGGLISGFFGGLSGHQGAFRSAFLIRSGLDKEVFIATAALAAILVDISRLLVYGLKMESLPMGPVLIGIGGALAGSFLGARLLKKVTFRHVRQGVGALLVIYGLALMLGLI